MNQTAESVPPNDRVWVRWPSHGRVAGYTMVILGVAVGAYALYQIRTVLFLFLVAVLLATAIEPLVLRLRRGPFSHGQGILIVYTGIVLAIVGLGAMTVPVVLAEAASFRETYPRLLQQVRELVYGIDQSVLGPAADKAVQKAANPTEAAADGSTAIAVGLTLVEGIFAGVTVFVVAFYWLTERIAIKRTCVSLFPRGRRVLVGTIWNDVERVLGRWVRGQLILMLFIGVLAAIGYTLLGLKYALVLAVLAALLEIVPLVGPWLGAIPALLVALTQDVHLVPAVAAYILVIQLIEGNILVPRVMSHTVGVSSLVVILGLLVGAALAGIPGALAAVPVAAAIQVILKHLIVADTESAPADAEARATAVEAAAVDVTELPLRRTA